MANTITHFRNLKIFLKTMFHYQSHASYYLTHPEYVKDNLATIQDHFSVSLISLTDNDIKFDMQDKEIFQQRFAVDAFYFEPRIFELLNYDYNSDAFLSILNRTLFVNKLNFTVKHVNVDKLKQQHLTSPFNQKLLYQVFQQAIFQGNKELYSWISPMIKHSEEQKEMTFELLIFQRKKIEKNPFIFNELVTFFHNENIENYIKKTFYISKASFTSIQKLFPTISDNLSLVFNNLNEKMQTQIIKETPEKLTEDNLVHYLKRAFDKKERINHTKLLFKQKLLTHSIFTTFAMHANNKLFKEMKDYDFLSLEYLNIIKDKYLDYNINYHPNLTDKFYFLEHFPTAHEITEEQLLKFVVSYMDIECHNISPLELKSQTIFKHKYSIHPELDHESLYSLIFKQKNMFDNYYEEDTIIENISLFRHTNEEYILAQKFINKLYELFPQYMNDRDFFVKFIKTAGNDYIIDAYIRQFVNNDNKSYINSSYDISLDLFCEILNNLFHPFELNITLNTLFSMQIPILEIQNRLKEQAQVGKINHLFPYFIEQYKLNPNELIMETVSSFISNDPLCFYIIDNYVLDDKIQQQLCKSAYSIDNIALAERLISKEIFPNAYYIEFFQNNPNHIGNFFLKACLYRDLKSMPEEHTKPNKKRKI